MKISAKVIKRDGRIEDFKIDKIKEAIKRTAKAAEIKFDDEEWNEIKPILINEFENFENKDIINISEVDDIVMETLIYSRFKEVAIEYIKLRKTRIYNNTILNIFFSLILII